MAAAEGKASPQMSWPEIVLQTLKRNEIRLYPTCPTAC